MTADQTEDGPLGGLWAVRVGSAYPIGMLHRAASELADLHLDAACQAICDLSEELAAIDDRLEDLAPVLDALEQHLLVKANGTLGQLTRAEQQWSREVRYKAGAREEAEE